MGCQARGVCVCVCVCVCVLVLYEHMREKVPDYENVVVVEHLCVSRVGLFNLVEMETISNFYLFIYKIFVLVLYYYI